MEESGATHGPFASLCAPRDGVGVYFWTQLFSRITDICKFTDDRPHCFGKSFFSDEFRHNAVLLDGKRKRAAGRIRLRRFESYNRKHGDRTQRSRLAMAIGCPRKQCARRRGNLARFRARGFE